MGWDAFTRHERILRNESGRIHDIDDFFHMQMRLPQDKNVIPLFSSLVVQYISLLWISHVTCTRVIWFPRVISYKIKQDDRWCYSIEDEKNRRKMGLMMILEVWKHSKCRRNINGIVGKFSTNKGKCNQLYLP